jgi:hypothetical protein
MGFWDTASHVADFFLNPPDKLAKDACPGLRDYEELEREAGKLVAALALVGVGAATGTLPLMLFGVGAYLIGSKIFGYKPTLSGLIGSQFSALLAAGLMAMAVRAGLVAATGTAGQVAAGSGVRAAVTKVAVDGGIGGLSNAGGKIVENVAERRSTFEGVPSAGGLGIVFGAAAGQAPAAVSKVSARASAALGRVLARVYPRAPEVGVPPSLEGAGLELPPVARAEPVVDVPASPNAPEPPMPRAARASEPPPPPPAGDDEIGFVGALQGKTSSGGVEPAPAPTTSPAEPPAPRAVERPVSEPRPAVEESDGLPIPKEARPQATPRGPPRIASPRQIVRVSDTRNLSDKNVQEVLENLVDRLKARTATPAERAPIRVFEQDGIVRPIPEDQARLFAYQKAGVTPEVELATPEQVEVALGPKASELQVKPIEAPRPPKANGNPQETAYEHIKARHFAAKPKTSTFRDPKPTAQQLDDWIRKAVGGRRWLRDNGSLVLDGDVGEPIGIAATDGVPPAPTTWLRVVARPDGTITTAYPIPTPTR